VAWLWLFTAFIKKTGKAINKTILTASTHSCKTGIIDGVETDRTNVTQCGTNTINSKDESRWQQPQLFTFFIPPIGKKVVVYLIVAARLSTLRVGHYSQPLQCFQLTQSATYLTLSLVYFTQRNSLDARDQPCCKLTFWLTHHCHRCTSIKACIEMTCSHYLISDLNAGWHCLSLYFALPLPASLREIFLTTQNGSISVSTPFRAPQMMWARLPTINYFGLRPW